MKILAIGDLVGPNSIVYLNSVLRNYISQNNISLAVVNAENASVGNGLCREDAQAVLDAGADVITTGNHIWQKKDIYDFLDSCERIVRPANYPSQNPGTGCVIINAEGYRFLVMNVMGTVYTESLESPFDAVERMLTRNEGAYDFSILDIHAETTSEKIALARYFDGRINVIYGTHTHVTTADEQVLPGGTGYITDLGMSGPANGVLGVKTECILRRLTTKMPTRFEIADGEIEINGTVFDIDTNTKRVVSVTRIKL